MQKRSFLGYLPYLFLLAAILALLTMNPSSSSSHALTYSELQSTLKNQDVTEAVLRIGANAVSVQGTYVDGDGNTVTFTSTAPATEESIQDLTDRLEDGRLTIVDAESGNAFMQAMYELVPLVIVLLLGVWMMNRMGGNNSANAKAFDFGKSRARLETKSKVRFSDVAGCDEEKA
ncbi:MAG: ATP-dependent metallopeptidase FtsH/Yme1/Tma family protein, partial [Lachnospiraceae bacterium]